MPNGDRPGIEINIGFDLFGIPFPRSPSPRDRRQERAPNRDALLLPFLAPPRPTIPGVPTAPTGNPFGTPPIFPSTAPQASDVVFKRGVTFGAGRLFGVGGLIISAASILIDQLEKRQLEKMDERLAEIDRDIAENAEARARRLERDTPVRADKVPIINPDPPDPFIVFPRIPLPQPQSVPPQTRPQTETLPEIVLPQPEFGPVVVPSTPAAPVGIPSPTPVAPPVVQPFPGQFESPNPFGVPNPQPSIFPSIDTSIFIGDLLPEQAPAVAPLTTFETGAVPSVGGQVLDQLQQFSSAQQTAPATATAASVANCPPCPRTKRECDDDLEEPRLECFKGLYRENLLETEFTPWNEIDCITGAEL